MTRDEIAERVRDIANMIAVAKDFKRGDGITMIYNPLDTTYIRVETGQLKDFVK